jgi:hypothetical protein
MTVFFKKNFIREMAEPVVSANVLTAKASFAHACQAMEAFLATLG